jgi:aminoglycoside phosphotransferase (APT) family kinase protein
VWDGQTRKAIDKLESEVDVHGAVRAWEAALGAEWTGRDVWVHGDLTGSNLLLRDDRLCGVIDFGCSTVGDPACDLTAAWTMFEGTSRERFMAALPLDQGTWARARGWALWKALISSAGRPLDDPGRRGVRFGWRWDALSVIDQVIAQSHSIG